jgi:hypothetical protein
LNSRRACFTYEKCNVPDGIRSRDLSHCKPPALPTELKEISTNTVSRGGYKPIGIPITLCRGLFLLHFLTSLCFVHDASKAQYTFFIWGRDRMVVAYAFNATFNNISAISWHSVLLVEETGGPGENHQPVANH